MKKLFSIALLGLIVLTGGSAFAQCTVNNSNTNPGFTPNSGTITQGVVYGSTVQLYVPATYNITTPITATVTVDSIHIASISGVPAGITYSYDAANVDGGGMTVDGGHNGAICFAGTSNAAVGTDSLTFNGTAYVTIPGLGAQSVPLSQLKSTFSFVFHVQAPQAQSSCDTIFSIPLSTLVSYTWQAPLVGYVSGSGAIADPQSNLYPTLAIAEEFTGAVGDSVTFVALGFAKAKIKTGDSLSTVKVYIYDNTGVSAAFGNPGAPGNRLDSTTITLKQAALSVTNGVLLPVTFPSAAVLTTGKFFVAVALPTTTGDTLVLLTDTIGGGGNGWGNYDNGAGWASYDSLIGATLGNLVVVSVCGSAAIAPTAAFTANVTAGCAPLAVNFTDNSTGTPTSWSWNFGDGSAPSIVQNATHTYTTAGTYTVTETATNTGGNDNTSQSITVYATPTATTAVHDASSSSSANGSVVVTAAGGATPYTYVWSAGSSTTDSLGGVAHGTYTVTITDANTCTTTASATVTVTGIIALSNAATVTIFPNPASDVLNLVWSKEVNAEVTILDLNGKVVSTLTTSGDMKTAYDVHSLASGAYIVRITDKTNNQQQSMLFSKF